ncbi:dihydrolipoamide acetyltransferase family protein [Isoptericola jiangsuensis]|nr:dihydrolipoamide acetyltransferase family protein [Stenotrophomonas sp. SAU14A_NAIMI4_5]AWH51124.1 branched-chain alpha-keto acid dehydrogenase subunit E2 [Stenotrophomonas sp. SAU14A_NAIMI4_5]
MSQTKNFNLPDLGEGLPDATIVEWFVKEGDVIKLDAPLVSMETAKAVVEVPSPVSGTVLKLSGAAGDIIPTGAVLATFEVDPNLPQRADGQDTGHSHGHAPAAPAAPNPPPLPAAAAPVAAAAEEKAERDDAGTVVGAMQSSNAVHTEQALAVGGVKAVPAVRATARKLGVDLARVRATGADGAVTMADVKQAAADGSAKVGAAPAPVAAAAAAYAAPAPAHVAAPVQSEARTPLSAAGKPMRTQPPGVVAKGQPEPLKGVRRNMARVMADAHSKVVPTTLNDDADIHAWLPGNDVTARLVRAIVVAAQKVPAMNAWFDGEALTRTLHAQVDIGIAVDTDDGLFVPALRNADMLDARGIREGVNRLREQVEARSIAASELSGYTISLSNFGMFAGRYATPVVVPPCVAIIGAGRARHQMTPVMGGVEAHKVIPLSVTFDHRAATGGEAARFLRAMMDDLALAS